MSDMCMQVAVLLLINFQTGVLFPCGVYRCSTKIISRTEMSSARAREFNLIIGVYNILE